MQLSYDQIKALQKQTADELHVSDPAPILQALNLDFHHVGNDSYKMKIRNENDASAYITIRDNAWKFKDFGTGKNGTIENVVMEVTGRNYKEALNFCLSTLDIKNRLDEVLCMHKQDFSLSQEEHKRIENLKEQNQQRQRSMPLSRVLSIKEIIDYQPAVEYLASRGIEKIPPHFKLISGEYYNKDGEAKKAFGVGILTEGGGADTHFLKKIGNLKTMNFGSKNISFFANSNSNKIAIFESKMDYAAAYQQIDLSSINVIIANSTSNAHKIATILKENTFEQVTFFNQNDQAGMQFMASIVNEVALIKYSSIQYKEDEQGKDINDLLLDDQNILERVQAGEVESFQGISKKMENIKEFEHRI